MRTLLALATGIVFGTAAALWIAARRERDQGPAPAAPAPVDAVVAQSEPTTSEEAPE